MSYHFVKRKFGDCNLAAGSCDRRCASTRTAGIALASALFLLTAAAVPGRADTILNTLMSGGYTFTNFDPTLTGVAAGSNVNGISNTGNTVGTQTDANNMGTGSNFAGKPGSTTTLNTGAGQTALGINSAGNVVGGNGATAFYLPNGGALQNLTAPPGATNAFGINDNGNIVGQYTSGATTPGFYLPGITSTNFVTINAPSGPDSVNAQSVNNNGLVVGFYQGTDGQAHGFDVNVGNATTGSLTGTAIADPVIPAVAGEPGATFVFSQLLSVNDSGLVAGYYGDSTTSQHGFLYNTKTGLYTFLDDPAAAFFNGVEVTQITGITNSGEIAGFYSDANGIDHSFVASPVPEPSYWILMTSGLALIAFLKYRSVRARTA